MSHIGFAYGIISVHYKISEYSQVRHACEVRCINISTYAILFSFAGRSWMSFWGWSGGQGVLDFVIEQEVAATKLPHWPWFPIWLLKLIKQVWRKWPAINACQQAVTLAELMSLVGWSKRGLRNAGFKWGVLQAPTWLVQVGVRFVTTPNMVFRSPGCWLKIR